MKKTTFLLCLTFFIGALGGPAAQAQIVRRVIGHAIAGKAIRSLTGKDSQTGTEAPAEAQPAESGGAGDASEPNSAPPEQLKQNGQ
jgi:hypothetical protein